MRIDDPMNNKQTIANSPSRQELEARIAVLEKQRAELIADRERMLAEVKNQSQWLQKSWRKLESERQYACANSQQTKTTLANEIQNPAPIQPTSIQLNEQPNTMPNRNAIQQFIQLQKGVRR